MTKIIQKTTRFEKNPNTKTTYIQVSEESKEVTSKEAMRWFNRLGGSESRIMGYTCGGYKCIKSVSVSPDRENKTVREYEFKHN